MGRAREQPSVLLSLGSNIEPDLNLTRALEDLYAATRVLAASRVFQTEPVAERPMPSFLNAALEVLTDLDPRRLKFELLRSIEARLGRQRSDDRNAPRTIDIDIAMFGDRVLLDDAAGLAIPDPEILSRAHVAVPLADVAPSRLHPVVGRTLAAIAGELRAEAGIRLASRPDALRERLRELEDEARDERREAPTSD